MLYEKVVQENVKKKTYGKSLAMESLLQASILQHYQKKALSKVFSYKFREIFQSSFSVEYLWTITSPEKICWSPKRLDDIFNTSSA